MAGPSFAEGTKGPEATHPRGTSEPGRKGRPGSRPQDPGQPAQGDRLRC